MKIIHLPNLAYPYFGGGKEVIVQKLAECQVKNGHHVEVWVHSLDESKYPIAESEHNGVIIKTFRKFNTKFSRVLPPEIHDEFVKNVENSDADLFHFHEHTRSAGLGQLRVLKKLNKAVAYTYHTPGQSCPQGGLLINNKIPCQGKVEVNKCTTCRYHTAGLNYPIPEILGTLTPKKKYSNVKYIRSLFFKSEVIDYMDYFKEFTSLVDRIQVYSPWVKETLALNNVPKEKIDYVPLGNSYPSTVKQNNNNTKLSLAFLGRCEPVKGIETIIDAVKGMKESEVEVRFFGSGWEKNEYGRKMLRKIDGDKRFCAPVRLTQEELPKALSVFDAIIIPSLWLETGPLTLFDAFNAGVPVIASNLGGLKDRIQHNHNGILFEAGSDSALRTELLRCLNTDILEQLKGNVSPLNTMNKMALDMDDFYSSIARK